MWSRIAMVAEIQGRGLLRRRFAILLLVALPGVFYLSVATTQTGVSAREEFFTLNVGVLGVAWAVAGGAFFLGLSSRPVDERLVLAGYRPGELVLGRLLFLTVGAVPIMVLYGVMLSIVSDADAGLVVLAVVLTAVVAVALGLTFASLLPRELEGVLLLIAVIGAQSSTVNAGSGTVPVLPFYGALRVVRVAWYSTGGIVVPIVYTAAATVALLAVALLVWRRRLGLRNTLARTPASAVPAIVGGPTA
jgi:hypothetical protein